MTRDQHAGLFGLLVILSITIVATGLIGWVVSYLLPRVDWQKMAAEIANTPWWTFMVLGGLAMLLVVLSIGKATEPYR